MFHDTHHYTAAETSKICWGVPGLGPYALHQPSSTTGQGDDIFPSLVEDGDDYLCQIVDSLVVPSVVLKRRKLASKTSEDAFYDSTAAVKETVTPLCSAISPSIAFVSIAHTYGQLTCMDMSTNAEYVVGGFDNSIVRLWHNTPEETSHHKSDHMMRTALPRINNVPNAHVLKSLREDIDAKDDKTTTFIGHSKTVLSVSIDSSTTCVNSARMVVSSAADETIRLWDSRLGQCVAKYSSGDSQGSAWSVCFSPLGYYFLAGYQGGMGALYCSDRLTCLRVFSGHASDVTCCAWHPNMCYAVTGSDDCTVRLWDIRKKGRCVRLLAGSSSYKLSTPCSIQTSECGRMIAAGCEDGSIAVWDIDSGQLHAVLREGHGVSPAHSLSFNHPEKNESMETNLSNVLVSGGADNTVSLWDLSTLSSNIQTCTSAAQSVKVTPIILNPHKVYHTKSTPVYFVKYNKQNMIYGGGPFLSSGIA